MDYLKKEQPMKTLIVYFSLSGNTKWMAEQIHHQLPDSTVHMVEMKDKPLKSKWLQMMVYGFKTTFYQDIPIKESHLNLSDYDTIIFGSPVWAGNVRPPMLAFLI